MIIKQLKCLFGAKLRNFFQFFPTTTHCFKTSQLRGLKIASPKNGVLWLLFLLSGPASAAMHFSFELQGLDGGGVLTGNFSADDLNTNGIIESSNGEVVAFNYSLTGDTGIPDLSFSIPDFNSAFTVIYNYQANPGVLGDDANEHLLLVNTDVGNGFLDTVFANCNVFATCDGVGDTYVLQTGGSSEEVFSNSPNFLSVQQVPLPGTGLLFATTLGGLCGVRFRRN